MVLKHEQLMAIQYVYFIMTRMCLYGYQWIWQVQLTYLNALYEEYNGNAMICTNSGYHVLLPHFSEHLAMTLASDES